jgi:hypothetical protein
MNPHPLVYIHADNDKEKEEKSLQTNRIHKKVG